MKLGQYQIIWIIGVLIFVMGLIHLFKQYHITYEGWDTYVRNQYGQVSTGASPILTYDKPLYRKPYMWPQTFWTDVMGYPHMEGLTKAG